MSDYAINLSSDIDKIMAGDDDRLMTVSSSESKPLPRGDGIAVWRRIADWIRTEIAEGRLEPDERLPSEADLAGRFDVNRHTVRRALASLAEEGIVRSAQGRGTFIEHGRIPYPIGPRTRFTEILAAEGHVAGGELIEAISMAASRPVAVRLRIAQESPVVCARIRRLVDGEPMSVSNNYFPLPRFAAFAEAFRQTGAVTPALAACGVTDYHRVQTRITSRRATEAEAISLGLEAGGILLVTESLNVDSDGTPIQLAEAHFCADRIELVIDSGFSGRTDR